MHARYYNHNMGRFLSPDVHTGVLSSSQTWNRYQYAMNNPLRMVDRNGLWPTETHNTMLAKAFPNLPMEYMAVLQTASSNADSILMGGQARSRSYEHGMRAAW